MLHTVHSLHSFVALSLRLVKVYTNTFSATFSAIMRHLSHLANCTSIRRFANAWKISKLFRFHFSPSSIFCMPVVLFYLHWLNWLTVSLSDILFHLDLVDFSLFSHPFIADETYRHCYPSELAAAAAVIVLVAIGSFTNRDYHSAIKSPSIRLITLGA